jgi:hypothetical protein
MRTAVVDDEAESTANSNALGIRRGLLYAPRSAEHGWIYQEAGSCYFGF